MTGYVSNHEPCAAEFSNGDPSAAHSSLMESGVELVAVDFPKANRLTVHILAAVAEHEVTMISARTKTAPLPPPKRAE
jgi:hypothetical protein